jgi:hypothetical protein
MILQIIPYSDLLNLLYSISITDLNISIITTIEIFILGGIILFSGQLSLDMGGKAVAIVAGSTIIYKNLKDSGSGSGSDDKDKKKKINTIIKKMKIKKIILQAIQKAIKKIIWFNLLLYHLFYLIYTSIFMKTLLL